MHSVIAPSFRTPLRCALRLAFGAALATYALCANANLIAPTILVDDPFDFSATLDLTEFSVDSYSFTSSNWSVDVLEDFIGSEVLPNGFRVSARHLVAPHLGEAAPNPLELVTFLFANSFSPGGPAQGPATDTVAHGTDFDILQVTYGPIDASSSRFTITASHVPEPTTILLLGIGATAFALTRRARTKPIRA